MELIIRSPYNRKSVEATVCGPVIVIGPGSWPGQRMEKPMVSGLDDEIVIEDVSAIVCPPTTRTHRERALWFMAALEAAGLRWYRNGRYLDGISEHDSELGVIPYIGLDRRTTAGVLEGIAALVRKGEDWRRDDIFGAADNPNPYSRDQSIDWYRALDAIQRRDVYRQAGLHRRTSLPPIEDAGTGPLPPLPDPTTDDGTVEHWPWDERPFVRLPIQVRSWARFSPSTNRFHVATDGTISYVERGSDGNGNRRYYWSTDHDLNDEDARKVRAAWLDCFGRRWCYHSFGDDENGVPIETVLCADEHGIIWRWGKSRYSLYEPVRLAGDDDVTAVVRDRIARKYAGIAARKASAA